MKNVTLHGEIILFITDLLYDDKIIYSRADSQ